MILRHCLAAALAACFALPCTTALAEDTVDAGIPTAVLVHGDLTTLRSLPKNEAAYISMRDAYVPPPNTYADAVGGALGMALAGAIVNQEAQHRLQREADAELAPLTEPLGKEGLKPLLRTAFDRALAAQGMDQVALAFTGRTDPEPAMFERLPAARTAQRFLVVESGALAQGAVPRPVAMHDTQRQLRLSLAIELREGRPERNRRVFQRDVAVYTDPLALDDGEEPLARLGADNAAGFRAALSLAVSDALALAAADREFPKVGKDDDVGALAATGLTEFNGLLMAHEGGRALIWTRGDTLVSIPADQVLTGEALVAARADEADRRKPPVIEDEALAKEGDAAGPEPQTAEPAAEDTAEQPTPAEPAAEGAAGSGEALD